MLYQRVSICGRGGADWPGGHSGPRGPPGLCLRLGGGEREVRQQTPASPPLVPRESSHPCQICSAFLASPSKGRSAMVVEFGGVAGQTLTKTVGGNVERQFPHGGSCSTMSPPPKKRHYLAKDGFNGGCRLWCMHEEGGLQHHSCNGHAFQSLPPCVPRGCDFSPLDESHSQTAKYSMSNPPKLLVSSFDAATLPDRKRGHNQPVIPKMLLQVAGISG